MDQIACIIFIMFITISRKENLMPELSSQAASQVIGTTVPTIHRYIDRGLLPARKQGMRGIVRIDTVSLKTFAEEYGFHYNDQLAAELSE